MPFRGRGCAYYSVIVDEPKVSDSQHAGVGLSCDCQVLNEESRCTIIYCNTYIWYVYIYIYTCMCICDATEESYMP